MGLIASIPSLIHSAYEGDWERIGQVVSAGAVYEDSDDDQLVMSAVIRCSEAWARFDPLETARHGAGSYLGDAEVAAANAQAAICGQLPLGVTPPKDGEAVTSDVPVLLVLGEADPQNPPSNVADAPKELPNSLTVIVPGQAHTVSHLGCMPAVISSFVEAGSVEGLDVSCVATGVPVPPFQTLP